MANIFISYRREDSAAHAGRLCDRLSATLGNDRVFMDVQDIRPGQDFAHAIEETIASCDFVIAVIGPRWLSTLRGRPAIEEDFVHQEIAAALKRRIAVIPVLVGGAAMPLKRDLPGGLADLSRFHALEIRDARFDDDVAELTEVVHGSRTSKSRKSRWMMIALAAIAAAIGIGVFLLRPAALDLNGPWIAEMQKTGQQRPYRIRLNIASDADRITGTVVYPTGEGVVQEGRISGRKISFHTSHVPQFASEPATIRFDGEAAADSIRLRSVDSNGIATGVARRPNM